MKLPERLNLAHLPTPIHRLERLSRDRDHELWIWRDDLSGFELSGNKIRKLEFVLAEALAQGATCIVTCGGLQSNHVRATVFAARRLGLGACAVLREPLGGFDPDQQWTGNVLLNRLAGAQLRMLPYRDYKAAGRDYAPFLEEEAGRLRAAGEVPYLIGEGASSPLGCLGYFAAVEEMLATWRTSGSGTAAPDALFLALGSGGTHAGLVLGFQGGGLDPTHVHAVNVCDDRAYFEARVGALIADCAARFDLDRSTAPLQIHDGHVGAGYGLASDEDLRFYAAVAAAEGVLLDPCYTGKAFRGMLAELTATPERYGRHVLFLHSGGVLADFAHATQLRQALSGEDA